MKRPTLSAIALALCSTSLLLSNTSLCAADKTKVVFISGKPSHGPMAHEHRAGNLLLAKRLNEANLDIEAIVLPEDGYPEDPSILEDAATIVVFCSGHAGHLLNPHLEAFDALMKKGTGVIMIHWATEAELGKPAKKFLEWMGGFCDLNWSVNPHWSPHFENLPDHPIANGVEPFILEDEWYYHMRFVDDTTGLTPILTDLPSAETLKRPDGARSSNPEVRKAVAHGESQHVAWAYERPDGKGRGFGFTGGHNHVNWQNDPFRKVVLNAILWTAHVEVPRNGVLSTTPTDEEIHSNLDDKSKLKRPAPKPAAKAPPPEPEPEDRVRAAAKYQQLREQKIVQVDARTSLALLTEALSTTEDATVQAALLRGMLGGLEGRRNVAPPKGWDALGKNLHSGEDKEVSRLADQLGQIFGDEASTGRALAVLRDAKAKLADRRNALKGLLTQQNAAVAGELEKLLDEDDLRLEAIRGYGAMYIEGAGEILLGRYRDFDFPGQRAVIETLVTRKSMAEALLAAMEENVILRNEVPAYIARSLKAQFGERFTAVYGDLEEMSEDKAALVAKYKKLLNPLKLEGASAGRGRGVFQRTCAACHILYGNGGMIGPELTGSNRADLDYILLNMLDPSADIPEAYQLVTVTTNDGQTLAGTIGQEDDQRIVLNMVGLTSTVLKSDIKTRVVVPFSMMPEGLLTTLPDKEVLDLVKYLQTTTQVDLPQ